MAEETVDMTPEEYGGPEVGRCDEGGENVPPSAFDQNTLSSVKHVIGVVSGKGGVGKSMVTAVLADQLARAGYRVGILDGDITGPSIPRMFGLAGQHANALGKMFLPNITGTGIKVISANLLLENEDDPIVWRGPVLAGAIRQFWSDTSWGPIDYLLVDMPPGTGDVVLTVFQSLPVEGVVIVTSPQELVSMIVGKAVKMAGMMDIPVLGLVENMSYALCPDCGRKIEIFGPSKLPEVAAHYGLPVLGQLPIMPELAAAADEGKIEQAVPEDLLADAVQAVLKATANA